ncbi:hypothetical protein DHEL01_v211626 [Diaporthe helianthi]|uniref:Uncharacterized protein n=1 Tax=Diaporthe helianthi TaxID=158607 RepID=A0A2P5HI96_DIAHE|nr:hypothetical protein DHEL01_v211626 [Diaporthe helianthi]
MEWYPNPSSPELVADHEAGPGHANEPESRTELDHVFKQPAPSPDFAQGQSNHSDPSPAPFSPPLTLMRPMQVQPAPSAVLPSLPTPAAPLAPAPQQADNDANLTHVMSALWRNYWDQMIEQFGPDIPEPMRTQVLNSLAKGRYEWSSNKVYREAAGIDKSKDGDLKRLRAWMYSRRETTDATWRDTLRNKPDGHRKVPWIKREKLVAVSVIFKAARADKNGRKSKVHEKSRWIHDCKLDFLLPGQDQVVPDPYWAGFLEEYAKDPKQEYIYDNVVGNKQSPTREEDMEIEPDVPGQDQEVQGTGEAQGQH